MCHEYICKYILNTYKEGTYNENSKGLYQNYPGFPGEGHHVPRCDKCYPGCRWIVFGMPIAYALHKPFVMVRKAGKLPCETVSKTYDLEYGTATIEMHKDSVKPGQKVVLVDDLIATGGTMQAAAELVEELGGEVVKMLFLIELAGLNGRKLLSKYDVDAVVSYDGK